MNGLSDLGVATLERLSMQPDISGFGPVRCGIPSSDQNRLTDRSPAVGRHSAIFSVQRIPERSMRSLIRFDRVRPRLVDVEAGDGIRRRDLWKTIRHDGVNLGQAALPVEMRHRYPFAADDWCAR